MTQKKVRSDIFDAFTAGFNAARAVPSDVDKPLKEYFEDAWKAFIAATGIIDEPAKEWPDWMTK
jgi:hypothetical protein